METAFAAATPAVAFRHLREASVKSISLAELEASCPALMDRCESSSPCTRARPLAEVNSVPPTIFSHDYPLRCELLQTREDGHPGLLSLRLTRTGMGSVSNRLGHQDGHCQWMGALPVQGLAGGRLWLAGSCWSL